MRRWEAERGGDDYCILWYGVCRIPPSCEAGLESWLYKHCITGKGNPFLTNVASFIHSFVVKLSQLVLRFAHNPEPQPVYFVQFFQVDHRVLTMPSFSVLELTSCPSIREDSKYYSSDTPG